MLHKYDCTSAPLPCQLFLWNTNSWFSPQSHHYELCVKIPTFVSYFFVLSNPWPVIFLKCCFHPVTPVHMCITYLLPLAVLCLVLFLLYIYFTLTELPASSPLQNLFILIILFAFLSLGASCSVLPLSLCLYCGRIFFFF